MQSTEYRKQIWKEHWTLSLVLLFAFVFGLLFIFLVPPWQHYDEPGQFEYAWLIANQPALPQAGDYNVAMGRELAASMVEHDFFTGMNVTPNILAADTPVWISQTNDPPLYFWIVALPLRLVKTSDITFQLYLGRLVSLLFYLATIAVAYALMVELTPSGSSLRWIVPLSIAMLPSFVDLMTAINNDVGATAFFSVFLLYSVILLRRGITLSRLVGLVLSALLCWWVKNTVMFTVLFVPLVLALRLLSGNWKWPALGVFGLAAMIGLYLTFTTGDAAYWFRSQTQIAPVQIASPQARPAGSAFQQTLQTGETPAQIFQIIPDQTTAALSGKTISLGAWIWADHPQQIHFPSLGSGSQITSKTISIGIQPTFNVLTVTLTGDINHLRVNLAPITGAAAAANTIYYSGLVLAEGERPTDALPQFSDTTGSQGRWGSRYFQNLLRNPNAQQGWLRLRPRLESALSKMFPAQASLILPSMLDWRGSENYYRTAAGQLFRSFWAKFGWGHVSLLGDKPYRWLAVSSLFAVLGSGIFVVRRWRLLPWKVIVVLALTAVTIWGATLLRGINYIDEGTFFPSARYAYPAIIPTMMLFSIGWLQILRIPGDWLHVSRRWQWGIYILVLLGLDLFAVASIYAYYN